MTAPVWSIEIRRAGHWVLLDRFTDREAALIALSAVLADFSTADIRLRRLSNTEHARLLPPLVTRSAA